MTKNRASNHPNSPHSVREHGTRLEGENVTRVEKANSKNHAAVDTPAARRRKRPTEDLVHELPKRARQNPGNAHGEAVAARDILKANPGERFSDLNPPRQPKRETIRDGIAKLWTEDYATWPIQSVKANKGKDPHTPLDWGTEFLEKTLSLAQLAKSRGITNDDLHVRLSRAVAARKKFNSTTTDYLTTTDLQSALDEIMVAKQTHEKPRDENRSPTLPALEHGNDEEENQYSGPPTDTCMMRRETIGQREAFEQTGEEATMSELRDLHHDNEHAARPRIQTVPLTELVESMSAQQISRLADKLYSMAEHREAYEGSKASLMAD